MLFASLQTLYTYPDSFRAAKVLIAAQYSGASLRVVSEPPEFVLGETNKTPEFLAKFPLGKVRLYTTCITILYYRLDVYTTVNLYGIGHVIVM